MQMISSCNQKAEPETYLIPSTFTGEVNIFFNQNGIPIRYKDMRDRDTVYLPKMGNPIKYEKGRRIYEIPANGILLTQFKNNNGFIDRVYFSVDANNKRTPLEVFKFEHFKKDSAGYVVDDKMKKGIFGDGTSGSLGIGNLNIPFQDFTVSDYNQLDSFSTKEYLKIFNEKIGKILSLPQWLDETTKAAH